MAKITRSSMIYIGGYASIKRVFAYPLRVNHYGNRWRSTFPYSRDLSNPNQRHRQKMTYLSASSGENSHLVLEKKKKRTLENCCVLTEKFSNALNLSQQHPCLISIETMLHRSIPKDPLFIVDKVLNSLFCLPNSGKFIMQSIHIVVV